MSLRSRRIPFTFRYCFWRFIILVAACKKSAKPEKPSSVSSPPPTMRRLRCMTAAKAGDRNALVGNLRSGFEGAHPLRRRRAGQERRRRLRLWVRRDAPLAQDG